jgi:hypothetical protein
VREDAGEFLDFYKRKPQPILDTGQLLLTDGMRRPVSDGML